MHKSYTCIILGQNKHQGSEQHSTTPKSWPLHPSRLNPLFPYNKQLSRLTTLTKERSLSPLKTGLLLNNDAADSGKPYVSLLNQVFETRVQSLIGSDWYWLQQIIGDSPLAVLRCLAMMNQRCQEKNPRGLLCMITDLVVSNTLTVMASKAISYSQFLEF